jgi:carbon monoxide dehydrogenase subunit G
MAFVITETNLPGIKAMMEDLQLQMEGEGKTRIRYRIALQFAWPLQPFGSIVRMLLNHILRQSLTTLAEQLPTKR